MNELPHKPYHQNIFRPDWTKSTKRPTTALWLDRNEHIDPIYNQLVQKWLTDLAPQTFFAYPDCSNLYHKLAQWLNISAQQLMLTVGCDGAIRLCFEAFIQPNDKVFFPTPTFAMYEIYCQMYGADIKTLDYERHLEGPQLNIPRLLELIIEEQPKLICLPNPDSPTGSVVDLSDIKAIIDAAHNVSAIVLMDEAYYPFYPQTVLPWVEKEKNLIVTRSFSKAWGLAGLRLGYAVSNPELIARLHRLRPLYEIGHVTAGIAEKALEHTEEMEKSVKRVQEGKGFFLAGLKELGLKVFDNTHGNFLHVAFGEQREKLHRALEGKVLYRKDFAHPALAGYSRFTATTQAGFEPVLNLFSEALAG